MNKYLSKFNRKDCCGCTACVHSCPRKCISLRPDEEGFLYPIIDQDKCINCGLCERVCPMEEVFINNKEQFGYAVVNRDGEVLKASSSGGVFSLLAMSVIGNNGAVYAAVLDDDRVLRHKRIVSVSGLSRAMGSKYIQSELGDTLLDVRSDLEIGRQVLFVGTPCQVAGLKMFLKKDYDELICVDLLCHGVPSNKVFKDYVRYLEDKHHGKLVSINFRDKEKNGWSITLSYDISRREKLKRHYIVAGLSPYFYAFLRGMILRESCYACPYSQLNRPGDITLADYWGVHKVFPSINADMGCSAVVVNTDKGKAEFERIMKYTYCLSATMDQITVQNINFFEPAHRPNVRDTIFAELDEYGFKNTSKRYFSNPKRWRIRIKQILKKRSIQ